MVEHLEHAMARGLWAIKTLKISGQVVAIMTLKPGTGKKDMLAWVKVCIAFQNYNCIHFSTQLLDNIRSEKHEGSSSMQKKPPTQ